MVFADEIRKVILRLADESGPEKSFAPADVARALDQHNWPQLLDQVSLVADIMIREGQIRHEKSAGDEAGMPRFKKSA
ncbi:MAG TPA: DUF3253 domain-containing protein [Ohtaekwangia sp.]|nr:DUF3253 domain-containing protein [Ohtaekwangia sp.]